MESEQLTVRCRSPLPANREIGEVVADLVDGITELFDERDAHPIVAKIAMRAWMHAEENLDRLSNEELARSMDAFIESEWAKEISKSETGDHVG